MEISIRKSARSCDVCAREFAHGQTIHSAVTFSEADTLVRADHCDDCWTPQISRAAYSAWNTRFNDPRVADQQPPEVFSPLRRLFYEACVSEERIELAKAFLAAQLLRRQKVFRQIKESGELDGEVRTTLYTDRIGNQFIEVRDPNFTYAELDEARALLLRALRELEEGAPSETAEATTGADTAERTVEAPTEQQSDETDAEAADGTGEDAGDTTTPEDAEDFESTEVPAESIPESDTPLSEAG